MRARFAAFAGLALLGQGLIILARLNDHEAGLAGGALASLAGLALLALAWRMGRTPDAPEPAASRRASRLALGVGLAAAGGVVLREAMTGSGLSAPEWAILAYGLALVGLAPFVARRVAGVPVATVVAGSYALLLAPLGLYALHALGERDLAWAPLGLYVKHLLVAPLGWSLALLGHDVAWTGETIRVATARGPLFLTVGVACAGLYAGALFTGVFLHFAASAKASAPRLAGYLALGLLGLHVANVLRLVLLALVGADRGGNALAFAHRHAGWVFFLAWGILFWWLILRRFEARRPAPSG
ncbi:MAG TPA: archaeosortase/exosortase family protein [Candidatus Thermoplasmatota archaeon]|nr:archaeosortase/exosortase family protein [Candidatus Thermoplasmatota archaeon]